MPQLSRRKIAAYAAERLIKKDAAVVTELAALLIESGRLKEVELLTRDIETALAERGVVIADVTSARQLSADLENELAAYITAKTGATSVHFRETVDVSVIGGVRIQTPGREMDATMRRKLMKLTASKM